MFLTEVMLTICDKIDKIRRIKIIPNFLVMENSIILERTEVKVIGRYLEERKASPPSVQIK